MALPITREQEALLDPFLGFEEEVPVTPQTFFDLPPPVPTTNYFSRSSGRFGRSGDPYGFAEKAAEYRMAMAAEQQANELFRAFQQVDPSSPQYPQQRLGLISQLPLATRDPRGKAVLDAADFSFQQTQRRPRDPNQTLYQRAAIAGIKPEEMDGLDPVTLGNMVGERERSLKPQRETRDRSIDDLNAAYRALDNLSGPDAKKERERIGQEIIAKTRQLYGGGTEPAAAPDKATSLREKYKY